MNTTIRLKPGMDEIKNNIQKSKLRWFGHVIQTKEKRIPKKMIHTKNVEKNNQEEDSEPEI
jgi:hypothetical protein